MTTVILVGLIVVLLAAAAYVGVLLVRRSRSAPAEAEPDTGPATERPRTVADLIKRRAAPVDEPADDPAAELSGEELFVPQVPRQDGVAVPAVPDGPTAEPAAAAAPSPQPATPVGGLEIGDAPWRRAARMTGAEPGGAWETAPLPVVASGEGAPTPASPSVVIVSRAAPAAPRTEPEPPAGLPAVPAQPPLDGPEPVLPTDTPQAPVDGPEPALARLASPWTEPAPAMAPEDDAAPAQLPVGAEPADPQEAVAESAPEPVAPADQAEPAPVSRPLSDPDLTPLMGIPIIRPVAAEAPVPETVLEVAPEPTANPDGPAMADGDPDTGPVPRTIGTPAHDDDVVVLLPPTFTSSFPIVAPAVSGSPQPVWFRVVRRDGEPVPAAVVALLDDQGREVDTTKTATDGGGELRAPHGGRFLMIVSADGYQPRAATLSVDEQPVELALLLPRSAAVSGSVRSAGEAVRDARVVVRQDHDVVDESLTAGDGHYRFDDLAEGTYIVAAAGQPGRAVARLSLAEGADVHVDLDLVGPGGAR